MPNTLIVGTRTLLLDKEGYLEKLKDWNSEVAEVLAENELISLSPEHWEVITLLRKFHDERGLSPAMRILVKLVKQEYGADKGNSLYLLSLFPGSPAKVASKIAGLPRPTNCL